MAADGHLNFDTKINTKGFNKGLDSIGKLVSGAGGKLTSYITKPALVAASAVAGITLAKGWSRMVALDNAKVKLKAIGNSAEDVTAIMENALASVKGTAYGMDEAATTAASAVAAGIKPGKQLESYLSAVADAAAVAGTDMGSMGAIFNKVATQGKANNEVLQQMAEAGIPIYQYLADEIGVTSDQIFDMASRGEIDLATFENAVKSHIGGAAKEIGSSTISGALSNMVASISRIGSNLLGSADDAESFAGRVLPLLNSVTGVLEVIEERAKTMGTQFADSFGPIIDRVKAACDAFTQMDEAGQNSAIKMAVTGAGIVAGIGPALKIFGEVIPAVGGISGTIETVQKSIGNLPKSFQAAAKDVKGVGKSFGNLKDVILLPFEGLKPKIRGYMEGISALWESGPGAKIVNGAKNMVGSISGAFQKLAGSTLGAYGSLFGDALQGVLKSVGKFAPSFIKMLGFGTILGALVAGMGLLQENFGTQIDGILQTVTTEGPKIVTGLCEKITSQLPELIAQGSFLMMNLLNAITANIPAIVSGGVQIISGLITGIAQQLPSLIPAALQMIVTLVTALIQNLPQLINAGLQLLVGLAQGIVNAIPVLISAIPQIIQGLTSGIAQNLPTIILTGIQILVMLVTGIIQAIPELLAAIPQIFTAFAEGIASVDWGEVGKQILTAIVDGVKSIGSSLWDAVSGIFGGGEEKAAESGTKTGTKYAEALSGTSETVSAAATGVGLSANTGLDLANTTGAFALNAQNAANGLTSTLNANNISASAAGATLGTSANTGVAGANMYGAFSTAGTAAGTGLSTGISSQSGAVAGAASAVAGTAQSSISSVDLSGTYSSQGSAAMQNLAGGISSGAASVSSAAVQAANSAATGLKNANLQEKAKTEGTNFVKSLSNALKSGTGTIRTSMTTVITAAKVAANGLGSTGYTIGTQFASGLARGISAGRYGVESAATSVAKAAAEAAKKNLDINSPSKVGEWIGDMFDTGIAKGLIRNTDKVLFGMRQMTSNVSEGTKKALESLQMRAAHSMTASGIRLHEQATSPKNNSGMNASDLLNEWERRQRKLNQERDERPVLIDGRRVDRARNKKGVVTV